MEQLFSVIKSRNTQMFMARYRSNQITVYLIFQNKQ